MCTYVPLANARNLPQSFYKVVAETVSAVLLLQGLAKGNGVKWPKFALCLSSALSELPPSDTPSSLALFSFLVAPSLLKRIWRINHKFKNLNHWHFLRAFALPSGEVTQDGMGGDAWSCTTTILALLVLFCHCLAPFLHPHYKSPLSFMKNETKGFSRMLSHPSPTDKVLSISQNKRADRLLSQW